MSLTNATKDMFSKATERRWKTDVEIPHVGAVALRSISARESAEIEDMARQKGAAALRRSYVELVTKVIYCNDKSGPMFDASDKGLLLDLDTAVSNPMNSACLDFCGFEKTDLEDLAKNSSNGQPENSPTS